jgi:hypothetical protein
MELSAIIALIPSVVSGITSLVNWIQTIRTAAQQTGAWTPALEAQYQAMLQSAASAPEWQPDAGSNPVPLPSVTIPNAPASPVQIAAGSAGIVPIPSNPTTLTGL